MYFDSISALNHVFKSKINIINCLKKIIIFKTFCLAFLILFDCIRTKWNIFSFFSFCPDSDVNFQSIFIDLFFHLPFNLSFYQIRFIRWLFFYCPNRKMTQYSCASCWKNSGSHNFHFHVLPPTSSIAKRPWRFWKTICDSFLSKRKGEIR